MGKSPVNYIVLSEKPWNKELKDRLASQVDGVWTLIDKKEDFNLTTLDVISPSFIFIPHWSYIIPPEIFNEYTCVVFHMTDLPYGRGGSPLQNLIVNGFTETKMSAIKVSEELDAGDIYLKKELSLLGSAREIFEVADKVIESMIVSIIKENIQATPQIGEPYVFKRRKPEQSNIEELDNPEKIYDYIRMLDADGYPHAFAETNHLRFEFTNARLDPDKSIIANVRITKK